MSNSHTATQPVLSSNKFQWLLIVAAAGTVAGVAYWSGPLEWAWVRALAAGLGGAVLVGLVLFAIRRGQSGKEASAPRQMPHEAGNEAPIEHREVKPFVAGKSAAREEGHDPSSSRGALYESGTRIQSSGIARASRTSRSGHDL
jgi:hypothetical protein